MFRPKLFDTLKHYTFDQFSQDVVAGIVVGIVALPLSIAFAIASGVSPEKGIITAIVAGLIISTLGGSKVQIGGPTGAFVVIIYGIIEQYGFNGLLISTVMAGILLILMGVFKFGNIIRYIPYPVIVGFTTGIAVTIFSSQIKDFFGLQMGKVPADFIEKWQAFGLNATSFNTYSVILGTCTILIIVFWNKFFKKTPGAVPALFLTTLAAYVFQLPVETIGSRFGQISSAIPMPSLPYFNYEIIKGLVQPAITIALLGGIESLLSAVVADGIIKDKHKSNTELIAQGIANIASPLFGGIPATGAIARTMTNIKNGGKTPISGIIHSLTLLLIMLFFGKYAALIPLASLAGILIVVAYNMSDWQHFVQLLKSPRGDVAVLVITFLLTVLIDLTVAIEVGMFLSIIFFVRRMTQFGTDKIVYKESPEEISSTLHFSKVPKGLEVFDINGPLFFGDAETFKNRLEFEAVDRKSSTRVIRMNNVSSIDSTGIHALEEVYQNCINNSCTLIITEIHDQPLNALRKSGLINKIGEDHVFEKLEDYTRELEKNKTLKTKK